MFSTGIEGKINFGLHHDTSKLPKQRSLKSSTATPRSHTWKESTSRKQQRTKVLNKEKSKQVPQQRSNESKRKKNFVAEDNAKVLPESFFSINHFVPNLLFKCTDLRNSLISPDNCFFYYKLGTSFFN